MYNSYYYSNSTSALPMDSSVAIVFVVIALILALVLYLTVVKMKNRPEGAFMNWLREFFNFREIILEGILKFLYIFFMILTTISAFYTMFQGYQNAVLIGLLELTVGNILVRLGFELIMLLVGLWQNTTDIRNFMEIRHTKEFGLVKKIKEVKEDLISKDKATKEESKKEEK